LLHPVHDSKVWSSRARTQMTASLGATASTAGCPLEIVNAGPDTEVPASDFAVVHEPPLVVPTRRSMLPVAVRNASTRCAPSAVEDSAGSAVVTLPMRRHGDHQGWWLRTHTCPSAAAAATVT